MSMSKLILTYSSFIIACVAVSFAFITATTYMQLAVAMLFYPALIYFSFKIFPHNTKKSDFLRKQDISLPLPTVATTKTESSKKTNVGISDIDKRVFLKIIGGAGITLFLFSLFNKKAEGLLFQKIPYTNTGPTILTDITGNQIDPAQNQPLDRYTISQMDENTISFYGFTDKSGGWYIMKVNTETGAFRYAKGESDFAGSWNNRENMTYGYFNDVF